MQYVSVGYRESCLMSTFVSERHSSAAPPPATNCSVRLRALSANGELGRHTSLSLSHWSCSKRQLLSHWLFDQSHIVLVWYIQTQRTKEEDQEMRDKTIIPFLTKALFKFETACTCIDAMILDGIKRMPYRWLILKCKEVVPPRRLCYTWRELSVSVPIHLWQFANGRLPSSLMGSQFRRPIIWAVKWHQQGFRIRLLSMDLLAPAGR